MLFRFKSFCLDPQQSSSTSSIRSHLGFVCRRQANVLFLIVTMSQWTVLDADDAARYQVYNYLAICNNWVQEHWLHIDLHANVVTCFTLHGNHWRASGWHGRSYMMCGQPYALHLDYMGNENSLLHRITFRRALTMQCWIGYEGERVHCFMFGPQSHMT